MRSQPLDSQTILGVGSPLADHIVHVSEEFLEHIPGKKGGMELIDHTTLIQLLQRVQSSNPIQPGGSASNVIRSLAHLGHRCAHVGKIGSDDVGELIMNRLHAINVQTDYKKSVTPTGQVVSLVTPDGERTCRSYLGASQEMTGDDLDLASFQNKVLVHIEGYTLSCLNLTLRAMEYAKASGALVSFDLSSFEIVENYKESIIEFISNYVDICFANEKEIAALCGLSADKGCQYLNTLCHTAVVSMGKKGCWMSENHRLIKGHSYPVEKPLDTTGAGDLFAAGFLHGYLTKQPLVICADYGARLGASVVQVEGPNLPEHEWARLKSVLRLNAN